MEQTRKAHWFSIGTEICIYPHYLSSEADIIIISLACPSALLFATTFYVFDNFLSREYTI
jgi:hypothetical protein